MRGVYSGPLRVLGVEDEDEDEDAHGGDDDARDADIHGYLAPDAS